MAEWDAHVYDTSLKFVSDYGKELIDLLKPQKGESILDLGCGTGDLTAEIASKGAKVIGLDQSATMLEKAKVKYSHLQFVNADAANFNLPEKVDAVFSNAALHWITDQYSVLKSVFASLKTNGRLVAELGAKGNVEKIVDSIQTVIKQGGYEQVQLSEIFYFPSPAEYATLLEKIGFRVEFMQLFERPTMIMDVPQGFIDWIKVFGILLFQNVPLNERPKLIQKAAELMAQKLEKDERYFADYIRLRVVARKLS
ncbi:MAG: methyltransferase domain-containing protein [Candidatus Caenarcaniphilales bacterium]|nr:methyltransferase domain-containing protein [Candidatus Caenarcaniphilales bacterium]